MIFFDFSMMLMTLKWIVDDFHDVSCFSLIFFNLL